jgi:hypothetical protein
MNNVIRLKTLGTSSVYPVSIVFLEVAFPQIRQSKSPHPSSLQGKGPVLKRLVIFRMAGTKIWLLHVFNPCAADSVCDRDFRYSCLILVPSSVEAPIGRGLLKLGFEKLAIIDVKGERTPRLK